MTGPPDFFGMVLGVCGLLLALSLHFIFCVGFIIVVKCSNLDSIEAMLAAIRLASWLLDFHPPGDYVP